MTRDEYEKALFRLIDEFGANATAFSEAFWSEPDKQERFRMARELIPRLEDMTRRVTALTEEYRAGRQS